MSEWFQIVGPNHVMQIFGVKLVGVNERNAQKFLLTLVLLIGIFVLGALLRALSHVITPGKGQNERIRFWTRQGIHVLLAVIFTVGVISIWFDDPQTLAAAAGLVTAGLAFALQRVITAIAGYVVILRGKTFSVGDRIVMGGVRGDVIALTFTQTIIMEMGQPPGEQSDAPSMWVKGRQYTGRIVSVTNAKIFDEPVYNYSRDFPYLWEEMHIPISYKDDRHRAEQILLEAANKHTVKIQELSEEALAEMERRYFMSRENLQPRVFWKITDNWVELAVRFVVEDHGVRDIKDKMSRDILKALDEAGIVIASGTYEIVGFPPVTVRLADASVKQP